MSASCKPLNSPALEKLKGEGLRGFIADITLRCGQFAKVKYFLWESWATRGFGVSTTACSMVLKTNV
ncbi:hypothetical protein MnTg02_02185 [bacterium MnTg02]|nr:hypothetical protein MnTg02_02185 [bacterium MnTg02]